MPVVNVGTTAATAIPPTVAAKAGVSKGSVAAVRAHTTMGSYA